MAVYSALLGRYPVVCVQQTTDSLLCVGAGLVRGSAALSFLQWFGRSNVLFLVLHSIPEVRQWAFEGRSAGL